MEIPIFLNFEYLTKRYAHIFIGKWGWLKHFFSIYVVVGHQSIDKIVEYAAIVTKKLIRHVNVNVSNGEILCMMHN